MNLAENTIEKHRKGGRGVKSLQSHDVYRKMALLFTHAVERVRPPLFSWNKNAHKIMVNWRYKE